jgi:putative PIN family toxin of toxin-antitoxin system
LRVFLDTSVLVAAFATRGLCADVVRTVLAEHELVVGETVLSELRRVLGDKIGLPEPQVREVAAFVRQQALVAAEAPLPPIDVRDANDLPILAAALQGAAEVLVTGDKDLLVLEPLPTLLILDPRGFWDRIKRQRAGRQPKPAVPRSRRTRR